MEFREKIRKGDEKKNPSIKYEKNIITTAIAGILISSFSSCAGYNEACTLSWIDRSPKPIQVDSFPDRNHIGNKRYLLISPIDTFDTGYINLELENTIK